MRLTTGNAVAIVAVGVGIFMPAAAASERPAHQHAFNPAVRFARVESLCPPSKPGLATCFAEERVPVSRTAPGAKAYAVPADLKLGPAGGYTPGDIAAAYAVNPAAHGQPVVAVVAAFDDPTARADLDRFDRHYGLPTETHRSFQKFNQHARRTPLPAREPGWAGEETVDLQAIRGLCHHCRIRLVEASTQDPVDLAVAENAAVTLHPLVINNSFGFAESTVNRAFAKAFDHPGIVITASNGDAGMYDWDLINSGQFAAPGEPEAPASLPTVVAVGGTTLHLGPHASYLEESVWNSDGPDNNAGGATEHSMGASGGGCSLRYLAPRWQRSVSDWSATGCHRYRLAADISADADPFTGYDVYQGYGNLSPGWVTAGGTSLATPFISAMFALAGGAHGVRYPAATLYRHLAATPHMLHDVQVGGDGYCGGDTAKHCVTRAGGNPNHINGTIVDCAFRPRGVRPRTTTAACDARSGFDGASGVGTPRGLALFQLSR